MWRNSKLKCDKVRRQAIWANMYMNITEECSFGSEFNTTKQNHIICSSIYQMYEQQKQGRGRLVLQLLTAHQQTHSGKKLNHSQCLTDEITEHISSPIFCTQQLTFESECGVKSKHVAYKAHTYYATNWAVCTFQCYVVVNMGDLGEKLKLSSVDVGAVSDNELAACVRHMKRSESCRTAWAHRMWLDPLFCHTAERLCRRRFAVILLLCSMTGQNWKMEVGNRCFMINEVKCQI